MKQYVTSQRINYGLRILPIKRLEIFSAEDWERFIEEWLDLKKADFTEIERYGGPGDKGRDVVAYITDKNKYPYKWECYQCKHYDNALMPSQVWVEFGKILYHSFLKDFPIPQKYYFIAPKGCGTSLSKLLQKPDLLKSDIKKNWNNYIKDSITDKEILLEGNFLEYVESFDFSIFDKKQPKLIIKEHSAHPNHLLFFGGGLPDRNKLDESQIPHEIQHNETIYVSELLKAYSSEGITTIENVSKIPENSAYLRHFKRARINFHHAEQLRNFSRDNLPVGTFENFQEEVYDSVINIIDASHPNGFEKVKDVENHATSIHISSNPLKEVSIMKDKTGVCHQLCNNGRIKWVNDGK